MCPIVMLHHVDENKSIKNWNISPQKFIELLDCIVEQNLTTTTFQEMANLNSPKNSVIITFDDCYQSLFNFAIPELVKRKMKAVFYMPTAFINGFNEWDIAEQGFDKFKLMNKDKLVYLSQIGMEIGSHGHAHLRHNLITQEKLMFELTQSKQILETLLNQPIFSFAHPYGIVPKNAAALLKNTGYKFGVGIYKTIPNNFALRRIGIHQSDTKKTLNFKLSQRYQLFRVLVDPVLNLLKAMRLA